MLEHDAFVDEIIAAATQAIVGQANWDRLEAGIRDAMQVEDNVPLTWLRSRLGLSKTEERVVWIMLANELDLGARTALRAASTEETSDVAFDTLRRVVFDGESKLRAWRELGPDGRLRRLGFLVRTDGTGDAPEHRQTFKIARRVLALAHGEQGLDPDLRDFAHLETSAAGTSDLILEDGIERRVRECLERSKRQLVILRGKRGSGRRSLLTALCAERNERVLTIDASALAVDRPVAVKQMRALARECFLLDLVPLVLGIEALDDVDNSSRLECLEQEFPGTVLATASEHIARSWTLCVNQFDMQPLGARKRAELWRKVLPTASEQDGEILSNLYPMSPSMIRSAGDAASTLADGATMAPEHIQLGIRSILDQRLGGMTRRIETTQTWDDVVLADEQCRSVSELLARARTRSRVYEDWGFAKKVGKGLGITALFSGPPGTGKTMLAGLVARELQLEMYQVDVSAITSKYIGETQKNLASLFDAAEMAHAVLLFDEADALFAKRSEVRSSNDRHSNQEVNYLLQRLESFTGIAILTTNHETSIDPAFQRRLSLHLRFNVPDEDEREKLWRAMLPAQAPVDASVDFAGLARRYAMTGGYIKNAALRAAFLAADEGKAIGDAHLEYAARLEYEGMGKIAMPAGNWPAKLSATL